MLQSTTEACQLSLQQLPPTARDAHILTCLAHSSLLSIGKLCNAGCEAKFNDQEVVITKNNSKLLQGQRNRQTGVWCILLNNHAESPTASNMCTRECNNTSNIPQNYINEKPDSNIECTARSATIHTNTTKFRNSYNSFTLRPSAQSHPH
jgi:hypothetical protein